MPATKGDFLLPQFLKKVVAILRNEDSTVVHWDEPGESIIIENIDIFSDSILPKYYKATKFNSFVRQLNFYGFKKISSTAYHGIKSSEFSHPYFRRDHDELLQYIKKKKVTEIDLPTLNDSPHSIQPLAPQPQIMQPQTQNLDYGSLINVIGNLQNQITSLQNQLKEAKAENEDLRYKLLSIDKTQMNNSNSSINSFRSIGDMQNSHSPSLDSPSSDIHYFNSIYSPSALPFTPLSTSHNIPSNVRFNNTGTVDSLSYPRSFTFDCAQESSEFTPTKSSPFYPLEGGATS